MPQSMNESASNRQKIYVPFVFNENETMEARYQRLYSEFERKLNDSHSKDTENLLCLVRTFSTIDPVNDFFSKKCLKSYLGHAFLTEVGYPNDAFRIDLLARAIRMIGHPDDTSNENQLNQMYKILPEGSSKNLPRCLYVAGLTLIGMAFTGLLCSSIPFAIAVTLFVVGILASLIMFQAAEILVQEQEIYQNYKLEICQFSDKLKFFQPPKIETVTSVNPTSPNLEIV